MPLATTEEMLKRAQEGGYAVGAFNVENMEMAQAVIWAAEELRAPVIIQTTPSTVKYAGLDLYYANVAALAKKATVPVAMHLDHGDSFALAMQALRAGYTSVMIDGSHSVFEENIAVTKRVVDAAAPSGVPVEAELGKVGGKEDDLDGGSGGYTVPAEAKEFVERTGVSSLAVAIGTAHGAYKEKPKLDIGRLAQIAETVPVPLVLHGGSGLSDEDFKNCVANGISKINIFTDINCAAAKAAHDNYSQGCGLTDIQNQITEAVKQETMKKMRIFGSAGRG